MDLREIEKAVLTVTYKDGSTKEVNWIGNSWRPIGMGYERVSGWPKAQMGGVNIYFTYWPGMEYNTAPTERQSDEP